MNTHRIRNIAAGLALASALTAASAAAAGFLQDSPPGESHAGAEADPSGSPRPRVEVLRIALRPTGFDPAALTAPRGRALLAVDDLSGLDEVTLRLERVAGGRLREVKAGRDTSKWRGVFNLRPGEYTLSV